MKNYVFPLLKAEDIEVRVGNKSKDGTLQTLLLYKTARTDAKYLDEVVGTFNWQKKFYSVNGFTLCSLGIYDEDRKEWVWKDDAGGESNIEKEKGTCSDAFKRAGFAWGIGRELYSAPTIWVDGSIKPFDLAVKEIAYNEKTREITKVVIVDNKGNQVYPKVKSQTQVQEQPQTNNLQEQPNERMCDNNQIAQITYFLGQLTDIKCSSWLKWIENNFGTQDISKLTYEQARKVIAMANNKRG